MQVIVGSVMTLVGGQIISVKTQKSILNICAKGGRFNNSKAEFMQMISAKYKKGILTGRFNNFKAILMQVIVGYVITLKRWSNFFC